MSTCLLKSKVMLGCKDLGNQFTTKNFRFSKKIRLPNVDTFTHHSHHQHASHKHFQEWIANFLKGDSLSQQVMDLEAMHRWEMLFHSHNTCTFIQNFSNITLLIRLHQPLFHTINNSTREISHQLNWIHDSYSNLHICRLQCKECISNISTKNIQFTKIANNA